MSKTNAANKADRPKALYLALVVGLAACTNPIGAAQEERNTQATAADSTDTGEIFDLDNAERLKLERDATNGNSDAAVRLARYWGMAGGVSGRADDPRNSVEDERWLRVAANLGNEKAKIELAVRYVADRDCAAAKQILSEVRRATSSSETRTYADDWLNGSGFCPGD